ncbi:MAG: hypothetical protein JST79_05910 [Acidobacteria bacterium]|nr:hypothetical protein [Acidobacteriota bacterium]
MTALEQWLQQATRSLAKEPAAQVRCEIQEHYESARETARADGVSEQDAERKAIAALGDAKAANCEYRKVLLTRAEARLLREGNWEARMVCHRPGFKPFLLLLVAAALLGAAVFYRDGVGATAQVLLVAGIVLGVLFGAPFLPIYTPSRSRVYRYVKWTMLLGMFALIFGRDAWKWSWLLVSCLWPVFWVEWRRMSIRRKLRVADWPKQLYL